jgi:hypothetical protein
MLKFIHNAAVSCTSDSSLRTPFVAGSFILHVKPDQFAALDDEAFILFDGLVHDPAKLRARYMSIYLLMMH